MKAATMFLIYYTIAIVATIIVDIRFGYIMAGIVFIASICITILIEVLDMNYDKMIKE